MGRHVDITTVQPFRGKTKISSEKPKRGMMERKVGPAVGDFLFGGATVIAKVGLRAVKGVSGVRRKFLKMFGDTFSRKKMDRVEEGTRRSKLKKLAKEDIPDKVTKTKFDDSVKDAKKLISIKRAFRSKTPAANEKLVQSVRMDKLAPSEKSGLRVMANRQEVMNIVKGRRLAKKNLDKGIREVRKNRRN